MSRFPQPDLRLVTQIDWARLAAYIDGEGCVGIAAQVHKAPYDGRGRYDYIKITVTNTDVRLSQWLLHNFGGHAAARVPSAQLRRWKACYHWVVGSARAGEMLRACLPYLIIKREQAEIALAFQATMCRSGLRGTPATVLEHREVLKTEMHKLNARGPKSVRAVDPEFTGSVTH